MGYSVSCDFLTGKRRFFWSQIFGFARKFTFNKFGAMEQIFSGFQSADKDRILEVLLNEEVSSC